MSILRRSVFKISVVLIFFGTYGCYSYFIYHESRMILADQDFDLKTIKFKIDGYYYSIVNYKHGEIHSGTKPSGKACGISPMFFYTDGYVRKPNWVMGPKIYYNEVQRLAIIDSLLEKLNHLITTDSLYFHEVATVTDWGFYSQPTTKVVFMQTYGQFGGDERLLDWYGSVKNDTTIILTTRNLHRVFNEYLNLESNVNQTYHYVQFPFKPDSALNYLKTNIHRFGKRKSERKVIR